MADAPHAQPKVLNVTALAMISVAGIVNLRMLPMMASVGLSAVFFYCASALFFLIPSALVCAELASSFTEAGGLYLWVRKAYGERAGFFAIWSEWFNTVVSLPATLSFIAATIAYLIAPSYATKRPFMLIVMLIIIWSATFYNFFGVKASSRLNFFGAVYGTLIPGVVIIILGLSWLLLGKPVQVHFSWGALFPPMHFSNLAFLIGVLGGYSGMQITAFHAPNVQHPKRDFPRAIAIAVVLIVAVTMLASLAIALVVPTQTLSLVSGVMEGFYGFLQAFHMVWAMPILILLIVLNGISVLSAWLLGPARGLYESCQRGDFPRWFARENRQGIPTRILWLQAVVATALSFVFLLTPNFSTAFWLLTVLMGQFTMVMYAMIFTGAIRLRYTHKAIPRAFAIPGKNWGIWLIGGASAIVCVFGAMIGFFPPAHLKTGNLFNYEAFLITADVLYLVLPIVIYRLNRRMKTFTPTVPVDDVIDIAPEAA